MTAAAFDADEDGWPDILVACDSTPSLLLMNNHDGTFRVPRLHFGLGGEQVADIEVRWPMGGLDTLKGVATNQLVTIREGSGTAHASVRLQSWTRR